MFSWLFKKRGPATGTAAPASSASPAVPAKPGVARRSEAAADDAARQAAQAPAKAAQVAAREAENWPGRLQQALGNDAALLALASNAPGLDIKLAAVEGLTGEDALRQAERAFRARDRRVHSLAKSRLGEAVSRRTSRATAEQLLQRGQVLLQDPQLPLNHLAALDRDWQALPAPLLEPAQCAAFEALREQLESTVRARADAEQHLQRWTAQTQRLLPTWQAAVSAASSQPLELAHATLADVRSQAQALLETRPEYASTAALGAALTQMLGAADAAQALVDAPPAATPAAPPSAVAEPPPEDATQPSPGPGRMSSPAREHKASAEQCEQLQALLQQASTALAEGQLVAMQQHLQAADALLVAAHGTLWPTALRNQKQALRAEQARLKDWQSWGGERARDDLIAEAEALARLVQPQDTVMAPEQAASPGVGQHGAEEPAHSENADEAAQAGGAAAAATLPPSGTTICKTEASPGETSGAGDDAVPAAPAPPADAAISDEALAPAATPAPVSAPGPGPAADRAERTGPARRAAQSLRPKINLRAHAEAIRALRMRWKALDTLGEGAHRDQWQRFDGALTTAYQPVAAQNAAQQAARQQNLLARQDLLGSLEAVALPASAPGTPAADTANGQTAWRELARQLDAFQAAWRQLGPVEHTAPADARQQLRQRLQAALDRVEQPLREARDHAVAERERLIQRTQALALDDARGLPGGELQRQLRALQAEWQERARSLPLQRGVENALWTRFRAATEAVFAQRDAAAAARDAEQAAEVAEREALIERLEALEPGTPLKHIESTLADVDRAWHHAPALLPRAAGQALETRYREARALASGLEATAVRLRWQAQIDAWVAGLQAADGPASVGAAAGPAAQADKPRVDELLLQLEIALDLPAAPDAQAARRQLKLRALKEAMEGRNPPTQGPAPAARWLATLLREPALDDLQRQRLLTLLKALREAEPGTLGLAVPKA